MDTDMTVRHPIIWVLFLFYDWRGRMFGMERELRSTKAEELLSQIEDLFSEFRLEYLEMSRLVDNAEESICCIIKLPKVADKNGESCISIL